MERTPPFFKQFFVAGATFLAALSVGGAVIYPSVLLNQLKTNSSDSSIALDFETSTWIGSVNGLAGIPSILMPSFMQWRGRKSGFLLACLILATGWIVALSARNVAAILISECLQGLGSNSIIVISFLSMSEMVAPRYRELFMQVYIFCQSITMALSGVLFNYLHWKSVAGSMLILVGLSMVLASMWPESPYWLAYKGKVTECKDAFVWLRGSDTESSKELENLIVKQRENFVLNKKKTNFSTRQLWAMLTDREFYIPAFHIFVLDCLLYWSGILVMIIYAMDIFKRSTQNVTAQYYAGLIMPWTYPLGILSFIIINKFVNKKTLMLRTSCILIVCLLSASLILVLQNVGYVSKDSIICMVLYMIYNFTVDGGLTCTTYPITSSLMPVKYRGIGGALIIINTSILHATSLKFAPYLFRYINLWGTFLVYAVVILVCSVFLWKFLPDIDGRTLQEIENYYSVQRFDDSLVEKRDESQPTLIPNNISINQSNIHTLQSQTVREITHTSLKKMEQIVVNKNR